MVSQAAMLSIGAAVWTLSTSDSGRPALRPPWAPDGRLRCVDAADADARAVHTPLPLLFVQLRPLKARVPRLGRLRREARTAAARVPRRHVRRLRVLRLTFWQQQRLAAGGQRCNAQLVMARRVERRLRVRRHTSWQQQRIHKLILRMTVNDTRPQYK